MRTRRDKKGRFVSSTSKKRSKSVKRTKRAKRPVAGRGFRKLTLKEASYLIRLWEDLTEVEKRKISALYGFNDDPRNAVKRGRWVSPKKSKKHYVKKRAKLKKNHARFSSKKHPVSLWVYYKGNVDLRGKLPPGTQWEGDGCCTDGFADVSYAVRSETVAKKMAKHFVKKKGVGWTTVIDHENDDAWYYASPSAPARIKAKARKNRN